MTSPSPHLNAWYLPCERVALALLRVGVLIAALWIVVGRTAPAFADPDPRFGDSTWVAPYVSATEQSSPPDEGPRVREPDHTRTYESVLRFPFRVVAFPFKMFGAGLGYGASAGGRQQVYKVRGEKSAQRPYRFVPYFDVAERAGANFGTYVFLGRTAALQKPTLIDESEPAGGFTDWQHARDATIALARGEGPGEPVGFYRRGIADFAWSLQGHRHADVELELLRGQGWRAFGFGGRARYEYRPNLLFFGIGTDAEADRASAYLAEESRGEVFLRLGADPDRTARIITRVSHISNRDGEDGVPGIEHEFGPADQVPYLTESTSVIQYGAELALGKLDRPQPFARGVEGRGEVWLVNDLDGGNLSWVEWRAEGCAYLPFFAARRVLALRALYASAEPESDSPAVPFYRLPTTTGQERFLSFDSGRFRDQRLALSQVEYRWWIWEKMWAVGFAQLGWVASEASSLAMTNVQESYGGGIRLILTPDFLYRLDIAHGPEGTETDFKFGLQF
jgi:hypothetical protein